MLRNKEQRNYNVLCRELLLIRIWMEKGDSRQIWKIRENLYHDLASNTKNTPHFPHLNSTPPFGIV